MIVLILAAALLQDGFAKDIDALIPNLSAESLEKRSIALEQLKVRARQDPLAARPILKARITASTDLQVTAALRAALDSLPKLELRLALREPLVVGGSPSLHAWVRNLSDNEICLPRLEPAKAWMFPPGSIRFKVTQGDRGAALAEQLFLKCGLARIPAPEVGDFVTLRPGEEADFLSEAAGSPTSLRGWKQTEAGTLHVAMTLDWRTPALDQARLTPEVLDLIGRIPREEICAGISIEVQEAK